MSLLEVHDLHVRLGGCSVLRGLSCVVEVGEIVTILGANGAGKTTFLQTVAGLLQPTQGRITFAGQAIGGLPAHEIAELEIGLVPEGRQLFPDHSVRENLEMGAYRHLRKGREVQFRQDLGHALRIFPSIANRLEQRAGLLSGGEQQMVAIARAMVGRPRLLLLDEPSLGLSPDTIRRLFEALLDLRERGLTILIVEQMARLALKVSDRAYLLEGGKVVLHGSSSTLMSDSQVIKAYLGNRRLGETS